MTTTATNTNTTTTSPSALFHNGHRVRRIAVAAGLTAAFAATAMLVTNVVRDDTPAVVVPGPYNGLPNLNDLGVSAVPLPAVVVVAPYNGLPSLAELGVTASTAPTGISH